MGIEAQLEKDLEQYDRVILLADDETGNFFAEQLKKWDFLQGRRKRVLLLSVHVRDKEVGKVCARKIGKETEAELLRLYDLYEFSDRFLVLRDEKHCGTIWNYVKGGLLTSAEAVNAILC